MIQQSGDDGSTKLSVGLDIINNRNSFIEIFNSTGIHEAEFRISNTLHLEVKPLKNASATISVMVSGDSGDRANLDLLTTFKENTSIISYVETGSSISNFMTGALFTTSGNTRKSSSTEIDLVNKTSIVNPVDPTAGNQVGDRDYNDARYSSFQYVDDAIEFASPTYSETINVTDTTTWWKIYDIEAGEYYEMIVNVVQPTLKGSTRLTFGRGNDSTTSVRLTLHESPGNHSMKFRITTSGHLEINLVEVGSTDLKMTIIGTSSNNPSSRFYNPIQNAGTSSVNTGNAITTQNVFQVRNGALHYPRNQSDPLSSGIGVMFVDDGINLFGQRLYQVAPPTTGTDIVDLTYTDNNYLRLDGTKIMKAALDMGNYPIKNVKDPTSNNEVGDRAYNDTRYLMLLGTYAMAGNINLNNNILYSPKDPTAGHHVGDRDFNDARHLKLDGTNTMTGALNAKSINMSGDINMGNTNNISNCDTVFSDKVDTVDIKCNTLKSSSAGLRVLRSDTGLSRTFIISGYVNGTANSELLACLKDDASSTKRDYISYNGPISYQKK